jgi:superfamily I DNA/RNA helicase
MESPSPKLDQPTDEQQAVLNWIASSSGEDGFVVARAGSGKSTLLTQCALKLSESSTLFLAFNRSVAAELRRRLGGEGYGHGEGTRRISTLHALGYSWCRSNLQAKLRIDPYIYRQSARALITGALDVSGSRPTSEQRLSAQGRRLVRRAVQLAVEASSATTAGLLDEQHGEMLSPKFHALEERLLSLVSRIEIGDSERLVLTSLGGQVLHAVLKSARDVRLTLTDIRDPQAWSGMLQQRPLVDTTNAGNLQHQATLIDRTLTIALVEHLLYARMRSALRRARKAQELFSLDFVDMLWLPAVYRRLGRPCVTDAFDWILVDEAQDVSRASVELIRMHRRASKDNGSGRVLAVGDPNQAIYGFAGADASSVTMLLEPASNGGRTTQVFGLSTCFRCPTSHIEIARRLVPDIKPATTAAAGEVRVVSRQDAVGSCTKGMLVIGRTNKMLD